MIYLEGYHPTERGRNWNWELTIFLTPKEIEFCLIVAGYGGKFHWIKQRSKER